MTDFIKTPPAVLSFPKLKQKDAYGNYSCSLMFEKSLGEKIHCIRELKLKAINDKFKGAVGVDKFLGNSAQIRDGAEDGAEYAKYWIISAKSDKPIRLFMNVPSGVTKDGKQIATETHDDSIFKFGNIVVARINAYASFYQNKYHLSFGISALHKISDGVPMAKKGDENIEFDIIENIEDLEF